MSKLSSSHDRSATFKSGQKKSKKNAFSIFCSSAMYSNSIFLETIGVPSTGGENLTCRRFQNLHNFTSPAFNYDNVSYGKLPCTAASLRTCLNARNLYPTTFSTQSFVENDLNDVASTCLRSKTFQPRSTLQFWNVNKLV